MGTKMQLFTTIFLSLWIFASSQDFNGSPPPKPHKRHATPASFLRQNGPKLLLIKRSPGISSYRPSTASPRILNNKTPLNLLQNGPYYINHYIYCDNLDQHTLDKIKDGTFSSDKHIQLLNLRKDEFNGFGGLKPSGIDDFKTTTTLGSSSNKEFNILHLPKDKLHHFDDHKLDLSLLQGHDFSKLPEIDLDLNRHVSDFEVTLGDIKPVDIDTSHLPTVIQPSLNDIVSPLIQGHIQVGQNHKLNTNLMHITEYLNQNGHSNQQQLSHYSSYDSNHDTKGEILDLPHFEKHPLENDSGKSSYDTPGAVDSYGHPATSTLSSQNAFSDSYGNPVSTSFPSNQNIQNTLYGIENFANGFQTGLKGNELYQSEDFITQLNEINGLQRRRRMNELMVSTTEKSVTENIDANRHLNHKYD